MKDPVDPTLAKKLSTLPRKRRPQLLFRYMEDRGQVLYDESVTQLEHALQCAHHSRLDRGRAEQIVAALLHDFGHFLLIERAHDLDFRSADLEHETVGAEFLETFFPPAVTEPIRLHVPAKRYLCTIEPAYYEGLSAASRNSLTLQGGPLSDEERAGLERNPFLDDAVKLRRWDDLAKVPGLEVPELDSYQKEVEASLT